MLEALLAITLIGWLATYLRMRARVKWLEMFCELQNGCLKMGDVLIEAAYGKPKKYENNVVPFGRK